VSTCDEQLMFPVSPARLQRPGCRHPPLPVQPSTGHLRPENTPVTPAGGFWATMHVLQLILGRSWDMSPVWWSPVWWRCPRLNTRTFSTSSRYTWRHRRPLQMRPLPGLTPLPPSRPLKLSTCRSPPINTIWRCRERWRQLLTERSRVMCWPESGRRRARPNSGPTAAHLRRCDPDRPPEFAWRKGLTACLPTPRDSKISSLQFTASRRHEYSVPLFVK